LETKFTNNIEIFNDNQTCMKKSSSEISLDENQVFSDISFKEDIYFEVVLLDTPNIDSLFIGIINEALKNSNTFSLNNFIGVSLNGDLYNCDYDDIYFSEYELEKEKVTFDLSDRIGLSFKKKIIKFYKNGFYTGIQKSLDVNIDYCFVSTLISPLVSFNLYF
jgi:hypothetical protein